MLGALFERRGAYQQLFGSGQTFDAGTTSGVTVTDVTALKLTTVNACVRLIADTASTLPVDQYVRVEGQRRPYRPREPWVERPSVLVDRPTFYSQVIYSLLLAGNAYVHVARDGSFEVVELSVLNPLDVEPSLVDGRKHYRVLSTGRHLSSDEVLHLTDMLLPGALKGTSRIEKARDALGLGLALEEFAARFFSNGAYAGGVIEWPTELTLDQQRQLQASWDAGHRGLGRSHRPAVLPMGAKFSAVTVDPTASQLIEQRKFAVEEVARLFRVPLFALGVSTPGAASYASVEQQQLHFMQHTVQPLVVKLEEAFSSLLSNRSTFLKFNLSAMVRADLATRTEAYSKALLAGYLSVNDVRALEDLRSVEDGDQYRVPLQNVPLTDADVVGLQQRARAAGALTAAGYTGDSVARLLDLDLDHSGLPSVQVQALPEPEVAE
jgi:HK97 family phage portal protein